MTQVGRLRLSGGLILQERSQADIKSEAAMISRGSFPVAEVRACLNHLGDAAFLAQSGLAARIVPKKGAWRTAGEALRQALEGAIEALRPATHALRTPRAADRFQALSLRYVHGKSVAEVCDLLSVSQREFYRLTREGLEDVTVLFQERLAAQSHDTDDGEQPAAFALPAPFVGRKRELDRFLSSYRGLTDGHGTAIVVEAPPGMGKSRLIDEFCRIVNQDGARCFKGHMFEDAYGPYDAWIEALAPAFRTLSEAEQDRLSGLYPDFFSLLGDGQATGKSSSDNESVDYDQRRSDFYHGVVELLTSLSVAGPLVLVLEDLQWAPVLSLFSYVVRRLKTLAVLVVASIREAHSLDRPQVYDELQTLLRGRHASLLDLQPLSQVETELQIVGLLRGPVAAPLVDLVWTHTLGNPFFSEELVRSMWERRELELAEQGWERREEATLPIPATLALVLEERIRRLPPPVRDTLSVASVLGERFNEGILGLAVDLPLPEVTRTIELAVSLDLLAEEFRESDDDLRFKDPMIREVLYNNIARPERKDLHLRACRAIENYYEEEVDRHTEELARHYHLAGQQSEGAVHAFRSGEKAEAVFAWGSAIRWYGLALSLWDEMGGPAKRQAEVCLKLGRVYCQSSLDATAGIGLLNRALESFQRIGDRQFTAMVHLELARVRMSGSDLNEINLEEALGHLNAARSTLEKLPSAAGLAQVYLGLYTAHSRLGQMDQGSAWVEKAREASTELEDPEVVAESMVGTAAFLLMKGEVPKGRDMFEAAWEIASRECLPAPADRCRQTASLIIGISLKDPQKGLAWMRRQPDYGTRWLALQSHAVALHTLLGEFAEAQSCYHELKVRLAQTGQPHFGPFPNDTGLFLVRSGEWDEALHLLADGLAWTRSHQHHLASVRTAAVYGALLLELHRFEEAEEHLQWAYETSLTNDSVLNVIKTAPALAELYVAQRKFPAAKALLGRHGGLADRLAPYGAVAAEFWLVAALYHAAMGEMPKAEVRFRQALDLNERFSLPWDEAEVAYKWALTLPQASGERDDLLRRAGNRWQAIGARSYAARCRQDVVRRVEDAPAT
jgi:tetratricopeptide (TPR) repeat protein